MQPKLPAGITGVGIFLFFASAMASLAGITLLWPGTILDRTWKLNPRAYVQLAPLGRIVGVPFLILAVLLAVSGVGWFRQKLWAWRLAVGIIAIQLLGDVVNALRGDILRGAAGVLIAGGLLVYLLKPQVRKAFVTEV